MNKICRACENREAKVGVYCPHCMAEMKRFRKNEKEVELYWTAINNGSGDLWRSK